MSEVLFPIEFPQLPEGEAVALNYALMLRKAGARVVVAVTYEKVTATGPRIKGVDFEQIHGVEGDVILGPVCSVRLNKAGEPYVLLDSYTRSSDPMSRGWTAIKPEGIKRATVLRIDLPKAAKPQPPAQKPQPQPETLSGKEISAMSGELFKDLH